MALATLTLGALAMSSVRATDLRAAATAPPRSRVSRQLKAAAVGAPRILRQWHGDILGTPPLIRTAVVYELPAWRQMWRTLNVRDMPDVDFRHALAVIVTGILEPGIGYEIRFRAPRREHGALVVRYCVIPPRRQTIRDLTFPWGAILVQARERKVIIRNVCPR
jgi:hypothetical protein